MPIYVKYGEIKGDVTAEGHKGEDGWVEVQSFQFGVSRNIISPTGGGKDRESGAPNISEITVTKPTDVSTTGWLDNALQGNGVPCQIDFCTTNAGSLEVYQTFTLENCLISGFTMSSGGDRPMENISISFTKIEYQFHQQLSDNTTGDTPRTGYDIALGKKV